MQESTPQGQVFVARHTGVPTGRILTLLLVALVFTALLFAYSDDYWRQMLSKHPSRRPGPATPAGYAFLGLLVCAPLVDVVMTFLSHRRGKPALVVSAQGVQGRIAYRWRQLAWSDIDRVEEKDAAVQIAPKRTGLSALLAKIPTRAGPDHAANSIYLPNGSLDQSAADILAAVRLYRTQG